MPPVLDTPALDPKFSPDERLADSNGGGPRNPGPEDGGGGDGGEGNSDPHHVPGAGLLAMRLVLVSVSMLFLTVGFAYYARSRSPVGWQHIRVPRLLWASTALILASGWTLEAARSMLRRNRRRFAGWLAITMGIGLAFLASQLLALRELAGQGVYLRHNPHSSLFYVLTVGHGLHLLGGMAALCYLLRCAFRNRTVAGVSGLARLRTRTGIATLYWHFLTVLWLALFLALLVWP